MLKNPQKQANLINEKKIFKFGRMLFIFAFIILSARTSFAESNIDFFFKGPSKYNDIVVKRVLKADTFILENNERIKLIGLRAPEAPKRHKDEEVDDRVGLEKMFPKSAPQDEDTIERKALNFAKGLVQGKHVRVEFDITKKDSDNKTLCYLFLIDNDLFVNAEIIRQGYARLSISPPNTKYEKELKDAYNEASKEQRGLQGDFF